MTIETDLPENRGLSSKDLAAFFRRIGELRLEVNTFILLRDGKAIARFCRPPYRWDTPQLLFPFNGFGGEPEIIFFSDGASVLTLGRNGRNIVAG